MKFLIILAVFSVAIVSADISSRITNGTQITNPDYAFVVRIVSVEVAGSEPGTPGRLASGVAITCHRVLTVAQAIFNFNEWYVGNGIEHVDTLHYYDSLIAYNHPDYDPVTLHNNVGIIYTTSRIDPVMGLLSSPPTPAPNIMIIFGYGLSFGGNPSEYGKYMTVVRQSQTDCTSHYNNLVIRDDNFCSLGDDSRVSDGDQGGPILNSIYTILVGIVSTFGETVDDPIVLTDIYSPNIRSFIDEHILSDVC